MSAQPVLDLTGANDEMSQRWIKYMVAMTALLHEFGLHAALSPFFLPIDDVIPEGTTLHSVAYANSPFWDWQSDVTDAPPEKPRH